MKLMSKSHALLKTLRQMHLYIGVFISPALLFFAFTGALQTFSLHETTRGSDYKPAAWIVKLGQLHKKQTLLVPQRKPAPTPDKPAPDKAGIDKPRADRPSDATAAISPAGAAPAPKPKSHLPMKIFFLLVSIGLFISTLTGIYMSYRFSHNRVVITGLLIAGVIVPLLLLPF